MVGRASLSLSSLSLSSAVQQRASSHVQQPQHAHPSFSSQPQSPSQTQMQTQRASSGRTDTGAWPCTLDGCNKVFAREADLKRHQRTTKSHSIPGSGVANPCPLCDATFTRSDAMRRHLKSRHQGRTPETLNLPDTPSGPSSSNISSGASSSRGANRRAYSPPEETSELSASDSEQQSYHHHHHHHQQTTPSSQQSYASSSRSPSTATSSASYYSSPPISPVQTASSPTSSHHGMHQNASNLSPQALYQAAMSSEIQHALSSPRQSSATAMSPSSSSSSRRDTTSAAYSMHQQQAVPMPMSPQQTHSSYSPYTTPVSEQYQAYQQYPAYASSNGYPIAGESGGGSGGGGGTGGSGTGGGGNSGSGGGIYANSYMGGTTNRASGFMMSSGVPWSGKIGETMMDDVRGISPSRQSGLATLAMHASRIRPMSPLSSGKAKSSKSELEHALGPAGVYRR